MRLIGVFLSACVILAALKAAVVALFALFLIALLWGLCSHPREIAGFVTLCTVLSLVSAHPVTALSTIVALTMLGRLAHRSN